MQWVTRENAKTDRIACPWLIKKYIDPEAEFVYVPKENVIDTAKQLGGKSFDTPGADYTHRGNKCSFEVLIEEFKIQDPIVHRLAQIVHGADVDDPNSVKESNGLRAIAEGFYHAGFSDQDKLKHEFPMYDALYAWCNVQLEKEKSK